MELEKKKCWPWAHEYGDWEFGEFMAVAPSAQRHVRYWQKKCSKCGKPKTEMIYEPR